MALDERQHVPVMLEAAQSAWSTQNDGFYVDCTFGRGGHAQALLDWLGPNGRLLGLDQDPGAAASAQALRARDARFDFENVTFELLPDAVRDRAMVGQVAGILFDLGVSSPQLDDPDRGFSFMHDGPLDMRMNPRVGEPVASFVNSAGESEIVSVLKTLGEERYAKRIARAVLQARADGRIESTAKLAAIVSQAVPRAHPKSREARLHPATKTFQALRIFINRELDALRNALASVPELLAPLGRLVVISFHSLEDRIVKRFIRDVSRGPRDPFEKVGPRLRAVGRHQRPLASESDTNPRARSAVLRVAERIAL
ncbi:MAG: 16S rRNA (cytosine(1402)-N(4))-methyltransferase RsmH [Pseudomonadota bacterium]